MSTLTRAILIATQAHEGQFDKAGNLYILHPLHVMLAMTNETDRICAVLHDVIEDTTLTFNDLSAHGFSDEIISAIDALTKRQGETRLTAGKRASKNETARRVKRADILHNMDLSRLPNPSENDYLRIAEYKAVLSLLELEQH